MHLHIIQWCHLYHILFCKIEEEELLPEILQNGDVVLLCIMKDSPNSNEFTIFKDIYKIDIIDFEKYDEIANKIKKDSHHIDIQQKIELK